MSFNITPKSKDQELPVFEVLEEISRIIENTFGPHGSTTIIEDRNLRHSATKDGYTVLKALFSEDDLERVILEFIKRVSMRLARTVGDGTSSAIVLSAAFGKGLKKFKKDHPDIYAGDLQQILNKISEKIQEEIKAVARPITEDSDDLKNVCLISSNNDEEIAELVSSTYRRTGKFGIVHVDQGDRKETEVIFSNGFEVYKGYIDDMFCNVVKEDKKLCELEKAYVLMYEGALTGDDIKSVGKLIDYAISSQRGSLVIIANGFDPLFSQFIRDNVIKFKGQLPICCIVHGVGTTAGKNHFYDASVYLGAKVVENTSKGITLDSIFENNEIFDTYLGYSSKAVIDELTSRFLEGKGHGSPAFNTLKQMLFDKIEEMGLQETKFDYDSNLGALKVRYGRLDGCTAVIKVGGPSKAEIMSRAYLVEDTVLAAKSALLFGVVPAGNISTAYILDNSDFRKRILADFNTSESNVVTELLDMLLEAYVEVFTKVSKQTPELTRELVRDHNILNVRTGIKEPIASTKVLNSARTDIEIVKGAISVVTLIGTSNQFINFPKQFV